MKVVIGLGDVAFIGMAIYAGAAQSPWWFLGVPVIVSTWFVFLRWDKQNGLRWMR